MNQPRSSNCFYYKTRFNNKKSIPNQHALGIPYGNTGIESGRGSYHEALNLRTERGRRTDDKCKH